MDLVWIVAGAGFFLASAALSWFLESLRTEE